MRSQKHCAYQRRAELDSRCILTPGRRGALDRASARGIETRRFLSTRIVTRDRHASRDRSRCVGFGSRCSWHRLPLVFIDDLTRGSRQLRSGLMVDSSPTTRSTCVGSGANSECSSSDCQQLAFEGLRIVSTPQYDFPFDNSLGVPTDLSALETLFFSSELSQPQLGGLNLGINPPQLALPDGAFPETINAFVLPGGAPGPGTFGR